jgi:hypothetical protein
MLFIQHLRESPNQRKQRFCSQTKQLKEMPRDRRKGASRFVSLGGSQLIKSNNSRRQFNPHFRISYFGDENFRSFLWFTVLLLISHQMSQSTVTIENAQLLQT